MKNKINVIISFLLIGGISLAGNGVSAQDASSGKAMTYKVYGFSF